jgi:serine phosphatase RsbU (regulator of sigma subunit)
LNREKLNYYFALLFLGVTIPNNFLFYFSLHRQLTAWVAGITVLFAILFYSAYKKYNPKVVSSGLIVLGISALGGFSYALSLDYGVHYIMIPFSLAAFLLIGTTNKRLTFFLTLLNYLVFYWLILHFQQANLIFVSMTAVAFIMGIGIVSLFDLKLSKNIKELETLNNELTKKNAEIERQTKISTEYKIAREIQEQFLPKQKFDLPTYSVDFLYQPSREVSGDFFDFRPIGKNKLAMLLVDVQGKGLDASFVAIRLSSIFRSLILPEHSPKEALDILNKALYNLSTKKMISVAYYLELNYKTNTIRYADAGMAIACIIRHNTLIDIKDYGGLPLGAYLESVYTEGECSLELGDSLFLSTDGVVDMVNEDNERFGYKNLEYYLESYKEHHRLERNLSLKEYMEETIENYKDPRYRLQDDLAAICIEHLRHEGRPFSVAEKEQNGFTG